MRRMMKIGLGTLAVLAFAGHAEAGLRAVYFDAAKSGQLMIEVADNGDARIGEADSSDYGLLLGGHFYIVGGQQGAPMVARIEDVGAAVDRVVPPIFHDLLKSPSTASRLPTHLRAEAGAEQKVGGYGGRLYHVRGLDSADPQKVADYVISSDPALAPVGRVLEQFMNAALVPAAVMMGPAIPELIGETREIFALGTPIDVGGRFRLDHVDRVDIAPGRLALPAEPATVDALVAAMKADIAENAHR
jgi:hypothetical protein